MFHLPFIQCLFRCRPKRLVTDDLNIKFQRNDRVKILLEIEFNEIHVFLRSVQQLTNIDILCSKARENVLCILLISNSATYQ